MFQFFITLNREKFKFDHITSHIWNYNSLPVTKQFSTPPSLSPFPPTDKSPWTKMNSSWTLNTPLSFAYSSENRGFTNSALSKTAGHPNDQDCSISESENWKGAKQCIESIFSFPISSYVFKSPHKTVGTFSTVLFLKTLITSFVIRTKAKTIPKWIN